MFGAIVVLWLGSAPPLPEQRTDIAAWARAHGLSAIAPAVDPAASDEARLVEQIEALLEEARSAPDGTAGSSAFELAEALLSAHPELPQAAWLMAERYALEAQGLATGPASGERGRLLLERARALEGVRAISAGLVPRAAEAQPRADASSQPARAAATGGRANDQLYVDGVRDAPLTPGHHQLQLYRGGRRVWATWLDAGNPPALAFIDPTRACSALDLADIAAEPEGPRPAPGVRCARWLAARPAVLGGTELAECAGSRCGRWQPAHAPEEAIRRARLQRADETAAWPSWATWSLVAVGAVAATGAVLWQAGLFDRSRADTDFVFTGPSAASYRF
jgi:hypothetical protein